MRWALQHKTATISTRTFVRWTRRDANRSSCRTYRKARSGTRSAIACCVQRRVSARAVIRARWPFFHRRTLLRRPLLRGDGSVSRPLAQRFDLFCHHHGQGPGRLQLLCNRYGGDGLALGAGTVERGDNGLLQLRPGKSGTALRQCEHFLGTQADRALARMDSENRRARGIVRQIDEENLIEPALANQLRRQRGDVVCRGDHKNPCTLLGEPCEEGAEHPPRCAAVTLAVGERFFDLVDPQHARCERLRRLQRLAQILLGLAVPLAVERPEIEPYERYTENPRRRACREALAATLHAQEQHALGRIQLGGAAIEGGLAARQPLPQVLHSADISKLRRVRFVGQRAAAVEQLILG